MRVLLLCALFVSLVACSGGGSGGGSSVSDPTAGAGGGIGDIAKSTWLSSCIQGNFVQSRTYMTVEDGNIVLSSFLYDDGSNCNPSDLFRKDKVTYSAVTSSDKFVANSTNINFTKTKHLIAQYGSNTVSCPISDWVDGEFRDVTNMNCVSPPGTTYYTIFSISGNSLFLGKPTGSNDDGSTPEKRNSELDLSSAYLKQ